MGPKPKNESDRAFIVWDAKIVAVEPLLETGLEQLQMMTKN